MTRAAKVGGMDTTVATDLAKLADGAKVSSWAKESAAFNINSGLVVGNNGLCRPQDSITSAEVATVVMRMLQKAKLIDSRATA